MSQTLTVQVEQVGPTTATAKARTHAVLVDRPAAKGGEDRGPLGGEYLLVGLGGCFLSNLLAAIPISLRTSAESLCVADTDIVNPAK